MLQCVAVCCSVLQCVLHAGNHSWRDTYQWVMSFVMQCVAVCCSVFFMKAILHDGTHINESCPLRCSVLQCVAVCCSMLQYVAVCSSWRQSFMKRHISMSHVPCTAVSCRALQCVAVCCSVSFMKAIIHQGLNYERYGHYTSPHKWVLTWWSCPPINESWHVYFLSGHTYSDQVPLEAVCERGKRGWGVDGRRVV